MSSLDDFQPGRRPVVQSHYSKRSDSAQRRGTSKRSGANKHKQDRRVGGNADPLDGARPEQGRRKAVTHAAPSRWLASHAWALVSTLGSLYRSPVSTLMTTIVIGIALALPAGLYIALQNIQALSSHWDRGTQISLFLHADVGADSARSLASTLQAREDIASVEYVSAQQALDEFRQKSGFDDALNLLDENPLPAVLVVSMHEGMTTSAQADRLMAELSVLDDVDLAQLDMQWLQRLNGLIDIGWRGAYIIASMLGLAILVIVSNTIRLTIQSRRQEIEVTKLIGGTDAFIQRPFFYAGIWYGMFGCAVALLLVYATLALLQGPVQHLADLYDSEFRLAGLGNIELLSLLILGILLSWMGSWFSVWRHLREIEPK